MGNSYGSPQVRAQMIRGFLSILFPFILISTLCSMHALRINRFHHFVHVHFIAIMILDPSGDTLEDFIDSFFILLWFPCYNWSFEFISRDDKAVHESNLWFFIHTFPDFNGSVDGGTCFYNYFIDYGIMSSSFVCFKT